MAFGHDAGQPAEGPEEDDEDDDGDDAGLGQVIAHAAADLWCYHLVAHNDLTCKRASSVVTCRWLLLY